MSTGSCGDSAAREAARSAWICLGAVTLAWLWSADVHFRTFQALGSTRVDWIWFPAIFRSRWSAAFCYLLPLAAAPFALLLRNRNGATWLGVAFAASSALLAAHQSTFAIQTWTSTFWACLWVVWLSRRGADSAPSLRIRATFLAQAVVSLVFLGAVAGKLTEDYWSGKAILELVLRIQHDPVHTLLRESVTAAQLESVARWMGPVTVLVEGSLAGIWLLPPRAALSWSSVAMTGLWLAVSPKVFDAVGPILGLAVSALVLELRLARSAALEPTGRF